MPGIWAGCTPTDRARAVLGAGFTAALLSGCWLVPGTQSATGESRTAVVERVIDGDTVVTDLGTVRVLGIDTPERGECGFGPATSFTRDLLPAGTTVTLIEVPDHTVDRYGRLLRYVEAAGTDLGAAELEAGLAVARYDSRDGYGWHPREERYVALDQANPDAHDYPTCPDGLR